MPGILDDLLYREPSPWMTVQEAASYLRCTEHTIHRFARVGKLKKYRVGGFRTVRLKRDEVEDLVRSRE